VGSCRVGGGIGRAPRTLDATGVMLSWFRYRRRRTPAVSQNDAVGALPTPSPIAGSAARYRALSHWR